MALLTRSTLKNLFKRGMVPSEVNFADLIDSSVNKVDDGFSQSSTDGFMLAPQGPNNRLISFYESIRDPKAAFSISMNPSPHSQGLSFNDDENNSMLFLRKGGNVGIGTTLPNFKLEVNGMTGMAGRVGTFAVGEIPADGRWHPIITDLEGVQAFEIMAHAAGRTGRGKYALSHAMALSTYGKGSIRHVKASYGFFWRKISFRWTGTESNYRLEAKTAGNYGFLDAEEKRQAVLRYWVAKLWDDSSMLPKGMTTLVVPKDEKPKNK
jgi:hypothetical protein